MPELPEVEVTRRSLQKLTGARVLAARQGAALRWPLGVAPSALVGRTVLDVGRRGKYVLLRLDEGVLLVHLGMSGRLALVDADSQPGKHDHFDLLTSAGLMRLHDPRRFGAVVWAASEDDATARKLLGGLGVEPLTEDFTLAVLTAGLARRSGPIKPVLMAGDIVVGVGNIYASEALFLAGVRPTRAANRLRPIELKRLHAAIVAVLARAVDEGGSSLRDFQSPEGVNGHYQAEAMVYAREGQPCRQCGKPIRSLRQAQRSSFFCMQCQK